MSLSERIGDDSPQNFTALRSSMLEFCLEEGIWEGKKTKFHHTRHLVWQLCLGAVLLWGRVGWWRSTVAGFGGASNVVGFGCRADGYRLPCRRCFVPIAQSLCLPLLCLASVVGVPDWVARCQRRLGASSQYRVRRGSCVRTEARSKSTMHAHLGCSLDSPAPVEEFLTCCTKR